MFTGTTMTRSSTTTQRGQESLLIWVRKIIIPTTIFNFQDLFDYDKDDGDNDDVDEDEDESDDGLRGEHEEDKQPTCDRLGAEVGQRQLYLQVRKCS